jgi:hypothetical protein
MGNTNRQKELIAAIKKDLTPAELQQFYQQHHIVFERVDLFRDLSVSLTKTIHYTYLGDEITPPSQQLQHFKWCWTKVLSQFASESIYFREKGTLYQYFAKYFQEMYYSKDNKNEEIDLILRYWKMIMSYTKPKRHIDLSIFITMYNLMSQNLTIQ